MPADDQQQDGGWHLDKKVPLGLIATILLQTATFAWWASSQSSSLQDHERRLLMQERTAELRAARDLTQEGRLARIEEGIRSLLETAQRLERRVDGRAQP